MKRAQMKPRKPSRQMDVHFVYQGQRFCWNSEKAAARAARARALVVAKRDMRVMTERLVECYRSEVERMRRG